MDTLAQSQSHLSSSAMDVVDLVGLSLNDEAYKFVISFMGEAATDNCWHNALMSIMIGDDFPSFLKLFDYMALNEENHLLNFIKYEFDGYHYARDQSFDNFVSKLPEQSLNKFISLAQDLPEKTLAMAHTRHQFISSVLIKTGLEKELQGKTFAKKQKKSM